MPLDRPRPEDAGTDDDAGREAARDEAVELLGLLAEPERFALAAALALGAATVPEAARAAGLPLRVASKALARLEGGGLVSVGDGGTVVLHAGRLKEVARTAAPRVDAEDHGALDPGAAAVLRAFVREGRLSSIPATRSKRLVVLDHLARVFEPGVRYPEREVNALLRAFHPDVAALRRHLVDEELLSREAGVYWRTGGTVEL